MLYPAHDPASLLNPLLPHPRLPNIPAELSRRAGAYYFRPFRPTDWLEQTLHLHQPVSDPTGATSGSRFPLRLCYILSDPFSIPQFRRTRFQGRKTCPFRCSNVPRSTTSLHGYDGCHQPLRSLLELCGILLRASEIHACRVYGSSETRKKTGTLIGFWAIILPNFYW